MNRQIKLISKERHSTVYVAHLTFKNMKSIPVKFQYKEIIDCSGRKFKIIPKGSEEQKAQIQITPNGIQIENLNDNEQFAVLAANGGQQIYEYEIHQNRSKQSSQYRKR